MGETAFEVIQELFKPEKIQFDFDTVVPVMQFDLDDRVRSAPPVSLEQTVSDGSSARANQVQIVPSIVSNRFLERSLPEDGLYPHRQTAHVP